jgi:hypothetical protein
MQKKTRYLLLLIGFIFFIFSAPIIVLYVRGVSYDLETGKFTQTGILSIKTEPESVSIFLNGEKTSDKAENIKFLNPKEYEISLKKEGYFEWSKRLNVESGKVTWVSPAAGKIYLLKQSGLPKIVSTGVVDFYNSGDLIIYLTPGEIVTVSKDGSNKKQYPLPKTVDSLNVFKNGELVVLASTKALQTGLTVILFEPNQGKFTDISNMFKSQPQIKFSEDNEMFALENEILYKINYVTKTKTAFEKGVTGFALLSNDVYYTSTSSLISNNSSFSNKNTILSGLSNLDNAEIIVNKDKHAFLLLDQSLYQVGNSLQKLADNVTDWDLSQENSSLVFSHSGELSFHQPFSNKIEFVTRSGLPISSPKLALPIHYAFFVKNNSLFAAELDTRDRQNEYELYKGMDIKKIAIDNEEKIIFFLDGQELKSLEIR